MTNKERFMLLCSVIKRPGIKDLLKWLEDSDFFTAPASSRYHCAYEGGLLQHSLNVYDQTKRLLKAYPDICNVTEESIVISTLFHDLCKANFYAKEKRNRKNDKGEWEQYDYYTVKEKFCYGGHGSKSVFILSQFINVHPDEAVAINCHMGPWDGDSKVGSSYSQTPFAWIVHVADEAASFIDEAE